MSKRQFSLEELEIGHTFPPLSYAIDEGLTGEYAKAVGDRDPRSGDLSSAREAGYRAILAPPTIAALYVLKAYRTDAVPPPGGVHLRQRFKFQRPILAGDVLGIQPRVADKYVEGGQMYLTIERLAQNQDGADVVRSESTSFWND